MFHFLTELRIVFGLQKQQPYGFEYNSLYPGWDAIHTQPHQYTLCHRQRECSFVGVFLDAQRSLKSQSVHQILTSGKPHFVGEFPDRFIIHHACIVPMGTKQNHSRLPPISHRNTSNLCQIEVDNNRICIS